jgi:hypothetical protein
MRSNREIDFRKELVMLLPKSKTTLDRATTLKTKQVTIALSD